VAGQPDRLARLRRLGDGGPVGGERPALPAEPRREGEVAWRCTGGVTCPAQVKQAILHFASRRAVEIEGLGDELVEQIVDTGIVRTLPDLYNLGFAKLVALERMGVSVKGKIAIARYGGGWRGLGTLAGADRAGDVGLAEDLLRPGLLAALCRGIARHFGRRWTGIGEGVLEAAGRVKDPSVPERLDAGYIAEDGQKHRPIMFHRAIFGSYERFIGILIEHYAGNFPLWLAPVQAVVATIVSDADAYANEVATKLRAAGLRHAYITRGSCGLTRMSRP